MSIVLDPHQDRFSDLYPNCLQKFPADYKSSKEIKKSIKMLMTFEPQHDISNNVVCVTSKASDQPAHTRSLIRAFASCLNIL